MDERIEMVNKAAEQGNIDEFYKIIKRDVKLLEDIDEIPFVHTPLHTAASAGHTLFAMEMMRLKPSFAKKLNPDGLSPIHLALQNGKTQMVSRLLQVDGELVRVKGREGITPLHHVAGTNDHVLLAEFLLVCPDSIEDLTIRNETALHIAMKNNKLEAFKVLVGWLVSNYSEKASFYEDTIPNCMDEEGNTVLHIAVSKNQIPAVSHLLAWAPKVFSVNIKNLEDKTAWDILQEQTQVNTEMKVKLHHAKAFKPSSLPTITSYADNLMQPKVKFRSFRTIYTRDAIRITDEKRNALLVVAVLLITVTYQAVLSPPGGLWQDDYKPETNQTLCNTTAPHKPGSSNLGANQTLCNTTVAYKAGTAIGLIKSRAFVSFLFLNTLTFFFSISMTCLLLPVEYIYSPLLSMLYYLCLCYIQSVMVITEGPRGVFVLVFFLVFVYMFLLVAFNFWTRRRPSELELLRGTSSYEKHWRDTRWL